MESHHQSSFSMSFLLADASYLARYRAQDHSLFLVWTLERGWQLSEKQKKKDRLYRFILLFFQKYAPQRNTSPFPKKARELNYLHERVARLLDCCTPGFTRITRAVIYSSFVNGLTALTCMLNGQKEHTKWARSTHSKNI